jgi:LysM repeat protein
MPLDSVLKWNNFTGKEKLKYKDGVKVKIKTVYHLRKDETLGEVSQKYNISEFILKDVNQIHAMVNNRGKPTLFEGKEIVIPIIMVK